MVPSELNLVFLVLAFTLVIFPLQHGLGNFSPTECRLYLFMPPLATCTLYTSSPYWEENIQMPSFLLLLLIFRSLYLKINISAVPLVSGCSLLVFCLFLYVLVGHCPVGCFWDDKTYFEFSKDSHVNMEFSWRISY